jgi:2-haloacid dehalogenase
MAPLFERVFGDRRALRDWFNQLVLYSNTITLAGYYQPFSTLGEGVLTMLGTVYGVPVKPADLDELRARMLSMPAHPDVPEGLRLLREAGFRLMTLTNSPPNKDGGPLERAGVAHFFERQFTVDSVRRFKPAPEAYRLVTELLARPPSDLCLIAAHTWDTLGAQRVGFAGPCHAGRECSAARRGVAATPGGRIGPAWSGAATHRAVAKLKQKRNLRVRTARMPLTPDR